MMYLARDWRTLIDYLRRTISPFLLGEVLAALPHDFASGGRYPDDVRLGVRLRPDVRTLIVAAMRDAREAS